MGPAVAELEIGSLVGGRYLVEYLLGRGGMGAVYFARDRLAGDAPVALKSMQIEIANPERQLQAVQQFRQEAQLLSALDHPGLVKVHNYFWENERYYLVMTYVAGKTLLEKIRERSRPFAVDQVVEWTRQILDVLDYLHQCKPPVIFRDLKPGNLIVNQDGRLFLIDFGIARILTEGETTNAFLKGVGSPDYCPLEQYQGGGTDQRTDLYSLGATMYHLLTLRPPPLASEVALAGRPVCSPKRYNPEVNAGLESLIVKLLELRKEDRFASVTQVRAALTTSHRGETRQKRRKVQAEPPHPKRDFAKQLLAALTLLVFGLLVWLSIQIHVA